MARSMTAPLARPLPIRLQLAWPRGAVFGPAGVLAHAVGLAGNGNIWTREHSGWAAVFEWHGRL